MSFASSHLASCVEELHKGKEDTGDFTLTCEGKDIKAHSLILSMGSVLQQMYIHWRIECHCNSQVRVFQDGVEHSCGGQQQDDGGEGVLF